MKLGELFIQLGVKGDTKKLDNAIKQLESSVKKTKMLIQYKKDLANATTKEERAIVKRNFADKVRLNNLQKQKTAILENTSALGGMIGAASGVASAIIATIAVFDRMANAMAKVNQGMINFQRQTGISFASLNKYTAASAAVNYNATEQSMAQTMQRIKQNLYLIQRGRGDISPYYQLEFEGGKPVDVWGKSVEQVIEEVREAIKGVDDTVATDIIQRMGFNPEDLLMLRMTKKEFDEISSSYFLSPQQREDMYKYSLELKKIHLQVEYMYQRLVLWMTRTIMPAIKPFFEALGHIGKALDKINEGIDRFFHSNEKFSDIVNNIKNVGDALQILLNPLLMIFYILEDIAVYFLGGDSLLGLAVEGFKNWIKDIKDGFQELANTSLKGFDLTNVIGQFSKLKNIIAFITPSLNTIVSALNSLNQYEKGNLFTDNMRPTATNSNVITNNGEVNNDVKVYTSQLPSNVINDVTQFGFAQLQMQPIV